jgi:hypothetical protein
MHPPSRHHFVKDQQGVVPVGDVPQTLEKTGHRRHYPHVPGHRLHQNGSDLIAAHGEEGLDRGQIVVGHHKRVRHRCRGYSR